MTEYLGRLKSINPLNTLSEEQLNQLCSNDTVLTLKSGQRVFEEGSEDEWSYYLLKGDLYTLRSADKQSRTIAFGSDSSNYALGNLLPRPFSLIVQSDEATMLRVPRDQVEDLIARNQMVTGELPAVTVTDFMEGGEIDGQWMFKVIQSSIFKDLPTEHIERFFSTIESTQVSAGQRIIQQGEPGDFYYMIVDGEATVTRSAGQVEFPISQLESGDAFGEEALVSGLPRNASVTMLTDGVLVRLARDPFLELLKAPSVQTVTLNDAAPWLKNGEAKLLDVRLESEHASRTIKNSENIPLYRLRQSLEQLDKAVKYITFCDSGSRSSAGAFLLTERGFDAYVLSGGLSAVQQK